jgi:hypothetical protein
MAFDLAALASELGLPAVTMAVAVGLVRGASALEKVTSAPALKLFSDLLTKGDLRNIGKAGAGLVPFIFDKVFGLKPFSLRFISRSVLATTLFWLILLLLRHTSFKNITVNFAQTWQAYVILLPLWYMLDWSSLLKSRFLITVISQKYAIVSSMFFLLIDLTLSYLLPLLFMAIFGALILAVAVIAPYFGILTYDPKLIIPRLRDGLHNYETLRPIVSYFILPSEAIELANVIIPSTLLTSIWSLLLFVSCLVAQLLVPIDYLRRFTAFWFRDVEHHPLTAIAWVAATLIVVGALAIKAVHWVY